MEPSVSSIYPTNMQYEWIMNGYISKSDTTSKNTIDRQYTERGACSVNYYSV